MTFIDAGSSAVRRLHRRFAHLTDPAGPDPTSSSGERAEAVATILAVDHWAERRDATLDRLHAREDRRAAREDRLALARIQDRTSS